MASPFIAAVLIVKNESAVIGECLASLDGFVDVIHVHDTGSTDDTVAIAQARGATVTHGEWNDDFAAARNAALERCDAEWVLSIDADETITGNRSSLLKLLQSATSDAFDVSVLVAHDEAPYEFRATRLFRNKKATWAGRVHEQLVTTEKTLTVQALDSSVLSITHSGYTTNAQRAARAQRNVQLAKSVIEDSSTTDIEKARAYVDLGRSHVSLGNVQDAADAFEAVRSEFPGTPEYVEATDFLTRLVLAEGMYDETLVLVQQLNEAGASTSYCDWLAAQALVQLHRFDEAAALLRNVGSVVDTSGRVHSQAALVELKTIVGQLRDINS